MKHSICVVTGTRAEYGLLRPLIAKLNDDGNIDLRLVVTGSHLNAAFGNTRSEIESDGFRIDGTIPIPLDEDSKTGMIKATGQAMSLFADYLSANRPELLVVLGDRFEIFAVATAAAMLGIPIAHIHGGETTEGAVDEFFRHSITKMSYLHFTACEEYRRRVIQLGEAPERVFNVGSLGIENIKKTLLLPLRELQKSLGFELINKRFAIVTYHPVTLESSTSEQQLYELIHAMDAFPEMNYIITKANADAGGRIINQIWDTEAQIHDNWFVAASLGSQRYLSALKYAAMMLGNSSSGIIEAPAMHVPTVNIGDRQKGRVMAESIICCEPNAVAITLAMKKVQSQEHMAITGVAACPFGDGETSGTIVSIMIRSLEHGVNLKKEFFDLSFLYERSSI
ncbi:UDP-N-acetylglucosamine 2-epimerase [Cloacibacillus evryensis]|uniref:UDP-N-acetylglucosamine 2-epimerase n=1 Tax=Cloacibacillus evryensis TaxID=508460 RepID=UPI0026E09918|nr:UDP-N-acetylglucosamine 2-epimerase [Cloacibacillus evryensis]